MTELNVHCLSDGFEKHARPAISPAADGGNRSFDAPLSVLVIEDDDVDFMLVSRHLGHCKNRWTLSHANSLGAALKELESRKFDVILTDLHLPDCGGAETVKRLKEKCQDTPLLVLTGLDDEAVEHEILRAGAQDYLPKGLTEGGWIRRAIQHAVERQRTINEMNRVSAELHTSHRLLREQAEMKEQDNRKLERLCQSGHEFLAKASHDIRNPLTVIKEYISLVREGLAGRINSEQASLLEKAIVRTDDVNTKLDDLLDSSKLESGLLDICRRPCKVRDIVQQVRSQLMQRAAMRKVQLEIQTEFDAPRAYCDEQMICRVLTSLASNAINACADRGHVKIWVRHETRDNRIRIGVSDNGAGISPDLRDRLSRRFQILGMPAEPNDKVFGLGLSVASRFCQLNLGRLHVESELQMGAEFWLDIPAVGCADIFPRWLKLQTTAKRFLQLIEFQLCDSNSTRDIRDTELLLTFLTENDELLLQTAPTRWLLASSSILSDHQSRLKKAAGDISRLAEVRAAKPNSHVTIKSRGSWDLGDESEDIVDRFAQVLNEDQLI